MNTFCTPQSASSTAKTELPCISRIAPTQDATHVAAICEHEFQCFNGVAKSSVHHHSAARRVLVIRAATIREDELNDLNGAASSRCHHYGLAIKIFVGQAPAIFEEELHGFNGTSESSVHHYGHASNVPVAHAAIVCENELHCFTTQPPLAAQCMTEHPYSSFAVGLQPRSYELLQYVRWLPSQRCRVQQC